jgi:catechol 2,3-dioxygenase-like lactoylglutathione lyase family enzyme
MELPAARNRDRLAGRRGVGRRGRLVWPAVSARARRRARRFVRGERLSPPRGRVPSDMSTDTTLSDATVATRLPARDLERARAFYADVLGLEPAEERPGGLLYTMRSGAFALFESAGAPSGTHTQMGFEVDDVDAVAATLRRRGLVLEEPGGVVDIAGNYPSKGTGERACWFRDSEDNVMGIGTPVGGPPSPATVVEAHYRAFEREDRDAVAAALTEDFSFRSPADSGFDKAGFLANCFPNRELAGPFSFVRLAALSGGEVLVTYEYPKRDGSRSRNTEVVTVRDGKIAAVEVYFGWLV